MDMKLIRQVMPWDANFGTVVYPPGGGLGPRVQHDIQLVMLHTGSCQIDVDGETHDLPVDHVAVMRPNGVERYRFDRQRDSRHTWISLIYDELPRDLCDALCEDLPRVLPTPDRLMQAHHAGTAWQDVRGEIGTTTRAHLATAGLLSVIEAARVTLCADETGTRRVQMHPAVQKARDRMERDYAQPLDLENLAASAHVTPAHLIRLFRHATGVTPIRRLWDYRTEKGLELLTASGLTIAEIADRCGFHSAPHFARLVRQRTGRSPTQYRTERWQSRTRDV